MSMKTGKFSLFIFLVALVHAFIALHTQGDTQKTSLFMAIFFMLVAIYTLLWDRLK